MRCSMISGSPLLTASLVLALCFAGCEKKTEAPAAEPPAAEPPAEQPTEQAAAAKSVQAGDATAEKRTYKPIPPFVPTPETIDSKIGRLEFPGGYPSDETAQKLADEMLYVHGVSAYTNTIQGASLWAIRKGFADIGVKDNEFIVSPEMMDGRALFLTANMDTYYFWSNINLKDGPIVVETPPGVLGIFDDFWFRWISDFGLPGPDRGKGGRYLLVPPGYTGELPEGGYFINHSRTNLVTMIGRMFLEGNSTEISEKVVKENLKVYPYAEGGEGTSIGSYLQGGARLGKMAEPKAPRMVDVSGISINTLPPADFGHFEYVNALVQSEPASALDPEIAGQLAAIGIVKGKPFKPDAKTRAILEKSVQVANAASRTAASGAMPNYGFRYYGEKSAWWNPLFDGGYQFMTPPPEIAADGAVKPYPSDGARKLAARTSFFYLATGITPAMVMRLTNIGSQYIVASVDADGNPLDGAKTYKLVLPRNPPHARFWSTTVYDNQTRSIIQTDQRYPRAGSQSYPSPAAEAAGNGTITLYFGPDKPNGVAEGNFVKTIPGRGWFQILRFYSPTKPFFDKSWQPGEVELVN